MGIFQKAVEKRKLKKVLTQQFKILNGYNSTFSTFAGGLYEMDLIRASIESIATQCSKLNPVISGPKKYQELEKMLQSNPNYLMTTQQFIHRLITILKCENNAFIIPIYENITAEKVVGLYPVRSSNSKIVVEDGIEYLVYYIGEKCRAIEYERVGHLRNHYYTKEYYGESNAAIRPTLELMHTQNEGIIEGIKKSANIRFLAKLSNVLIADDLKKEKQRLEEENLSANNNGGVLIFDNKYSDIKEINSTPFIVDEKQAELIRKNVFNYFHISEEVIQNKATEDQWNSFYEGCIEPLAIQLGQVLTKMLIPMQDIKKGTSVVMESNKLQFASNKTKLEVSSQMFDRGILTINQIMDIWNLPHVEDGDKRYIRKEYTEINNLDNDGGDKGEGSGNVKSNNGNGNTGQIQD